MRVTQPARNTVLTVTGKPAWPRLVFETDGSGAHVWRWKLSWRHFTQSGRVTTTGPLWDASALIQDRGGQLVVRAIAGDQQAGASVKIVGSNPTAGEIKAYLEGREHGDILLKIITQESRNRQFTSRGEPLRSFDNGFGLTQLTNPKPTYADVYNWQRNVDAGLALYAVKRGEAIGWLSRDKRSYTDSQLVYETVCRWNGGNYHIWDAKAGAWVRRSDVMCDTATGNIGWNMGKAANAGKTEATLRERDKGGYNARTKDSEWGYFGVCYADHVLG